MKRSLKKKWIEALLSGKYKQGKGALCTTDFDGTLCHCCLGVLAEVMEIPKVKAIGSAGKWMFKFHGGLREATVPLELERELGIDCIMLTDLNDCCNYTFEEIAKYIEVNALEEDND